MDRKQTVCFALLSALQTRNRSFFMSSFLFSSLCSLILLEMEVKLNDIGQPNQLTQTTLDTFANKLVSTYFVDVCSILPPFFKSKSLFLKLNEMRWVEDEENLCIYFLSCIFIWDPENNNNYTLYIWNWSSNGPRSIEISLNTSNLTLIADSISVNKSILQMQVETWFFCMNLFCTQMYALSILTDRAPFRHEIDRLCLLTATTVFK
jgi:hypothetical protein